MEPAHERSNNDDRAESYDQDGRDNNQDQDEFEGFVVGEEDVRGKIFIGGLSWSTTESTLKYYFEKYGELSDVALMLDKKSGKPRGFGFIKMKDPAGNYHL